jgi:deoxycytidylate deaminase
MGVKLSIIRGLLDDVRSLLEILADEFSVTVHPEVAVRVSDRVICYVSECVVVLKVTPVMYEYISIMNTGAKKVVITERSVSEAELSDSEVEEVLKEHEVDIERAIARLNAFVSLLDRLIDEIEKSKQQVVQQLQL